MTFVAGRPAPTVHSCVPERAPRRTGAYGRSGPRTAPRGKRAVVTATEKRCGRAAIARATAAFAVVQPDCA
jgi:hypothetical protein